MSGFGQVEMHGATIGLQDLEFSTSPPIERPNARRVAYLDGWRGLSIICVLVGHFFARQAGSLANLGVELFFVLSGRLMAEILFVEKYDLRRFFIKRVGRVWPGLIAYVLVVLLIVRKDGLQIHPKSALAAITFTYNYAQLFFHQRVDSLDHIWSLCVEEHTYVLLGGIALLARRFRISALPALVVMTAASMLDGALSSLVLHQSFFAVYWRTDVHIASILVSCALYLALANAREKHQFLVGMLSVVAVIAGATLFLIPTPDAFKFTACTTLLAFAIAGIDAAPVVVRRALSAKPLTWLGLVSFSVYLWQQLFYKWSNDYPVVIKALFLVAALAAGVTSFYCVEKPARSFINRRFAAPSPTSDRRH